MCWPKLHTVVDWKFNYTTYKKNEVSWLYRLSALIERCHYST